MTDKPESRKRSAHPADQPVHTITAGAVTASIWRRQSPSGFAYYDFDLKRSFRSLSTGANSSSRNFFACNQVDLTEAVAQATTWIEAADSRTNHQPAAA